jgi:hypothetical protein
MAEPRLVLDPVQKPELRLLLKRLSKQTQTVLFQKRYWTEERARAWLKSHNLRADKLDRTENMLRFRQFELSRCQGGYSTLSENFPRGISVVVCSAPAPER